VTGSMVTFVVLVGDYIRVDFRGRREVLVPTCSWRIRSLREKESDDDDDDDDGDR